MTCRSRALLPCFCAASQGGFSSGQKLSRQRYNVASATPQRRAMTAAGSSRISSTQPVAVGLLAPRCAFPSNSAPRGACGRDSLAVTTNYSAPRNPLTPPFPGTLGKTQPGRENSHSASKSQTPKTLVYANDRASQSNGMIIAQRCDSRQCRRIDTHPSVEKQRLQAALQHAPRMCET